MSKEISTENILSVFPAALMEDSNKKAIAQAVAKELSSLCEDSNSLAIYTRIEELP